MARSHLHLSCQCCTPHILQDDNLAMRAIVGAGQTLPFQVHTLNLALEAVRLHRLGLIHVVCALWIALHCSSNTSSISSKVGVGAGEPTVVEAVWQLQLLQTETHQ